MNHDVNTDPLGHDAFIEGETALFCISMVRGDNFRMILQAESSENPDLVLIDKLKAQGKIFAAVREEIYKGNRSVMREIIEKYVPIIRERLQKDDSETIEI